MDLLPLGMAQAPPASPWGINFGGGLNTRTIENNARKNGNCGRGGGGLYRYTLDGLAREVEEADGTPELEDRCHHGGCFT